MRTTGTTGVRDTSATAELAETAETAELTGTEEELTEPAGPSDTAPGDGYVLLPAVEPLWARRARADPRLLADIAHAVGGPFHVLYPQRFAENARAFNGALRAAGVQGLVYYGKKANKSACWLPACAESGAGPGTGTGTGTLAGVDVASAPELADALAHGVRGEELVVTGAAKSAELLWLAARHRCLIAVDALDELERVIETAHSTGGVRVLLRVLPEVDPHSRFGLDAAELERALDRLVEERAYVDTEGFSFHLSGYEVAPRAALAAGLVDRCLAARERGLTADAVSIGGGFAVSYLDADSWRKFNESYRDSWFHSSKTFSHFYPYHQSPTGADMLTAILAAPAEGSYGTAEGSRGTAEGAYGSVAQKFRTTGTRLLLEPGRALLDGAGFTVFPVQGFKPRADYGIVTVAGLSMSVSEQWKGSEYLPDPVLWPGAEGAGEAEGAERAGRPVNACVGGASCMEYDMLTWRKVRLSRTPREGDLLLYPNTAGYQMDKNETEFHQLPLPSRAVLSDDGDGFRWRLDR